MRRRRKTWRGPSRRRWVWSLGGGLNSGRWAWSMRGGLYWVWTCITTRSLPRHFALCCLSFLSGMYCWDWAMKVFWLLSVTSSCQCGVLLVINTLVKWNKNLVYTRTHLNWCLHFHFALPKLAKESAEYCTSCFFVFFCFVFFSCNKLTSKLTY